MPETESATVDLSLGPYASPRRAHRIILDHGDRAEVVSFDWVPSPALGRIFSHGGQRWQIIQQRPHARVWVAEPYLE